MNAARTREARSRGTECAWIHVEGHEFRVTCVFLLSFFFCQAGQKEAGKLIISNWLVREARERGSARRSRKVAARGGRAGAAAQVAPRPEASGRPPGGGERCRGPARAGGVAPEQHLGAFCSLRTSKDSGLPRPGNVSWAAGCSMWNPHAVA